MCAVPFVFREGVGESWRVVSEHSIMPLRYALETQFITQVGIIANVVADCEKV